MPFKKEAYLFTLILWIILLLFIFLMVSNHKTKLPQIHSGSETTFVKVVIHDTLQTIKTAKDIRIIYKVDTIKVSDSLKVSKDSSTCYSFDQAESDGAHITAQICSDSLPHQKPLDLHAYLDYTPAPDTEKIIARVDTILRIQKTPWNKDWKLYAFLITLFCFGGYAAGNSFHH